MLKIIGTMSGTSCDGIDVALIETDGIDEIVLKGGNVFPYNHEFRNMLKKIHLENNYRMILKVEQELTRLHAEAINKFLSERNINHNIIDFIGFHGHTVFHNPSEAITWQIGNASLLRELTDIAVVSDFRRRDIAASGQGAPLVPVFHQGIMKKLKLTKLAFLNIGGISNITYIDGNHLVAFDAGPGNALIDDLLHRRVGIFYDEDGKISAAGQIDFAVLDLFRKDNFYHLALPRSLDRNHFNYIDLSQLNLEDATATLTYITADFIKKSLELLQDEVLNLIVCGGGRKNKFLLGLLRELLHGIEIKVIDEFGIEGDLVEAYAFGYLAARSVKKLTISYPMTTGVKEPRSGGVIVQ